MKTTKLLKQEITYGIGDRFEIIGKQYLLCNRGGMKVQLTELKTGNLFGGIRKVGDLESITLDEMNEISVGANYKLIK